MDMKKKLFRLIAFTLVWVGFVLAGASLFSCKKSQNNDPSDYVVDSTGSAKIWTTRGDKSKLLTAEPDAMIKSTVSAIFPVILIDTSVTFQTIEGYGAALTGSSAYLINKKMNAVDRQNLLKELFGSNNGIGISYLRVTLGASDFSLSDYTYNDLSTNETDFQLTKFSLNRDIEDVVPILQQIVSINPKIGILASPWSAPAWMKTNNSLKGGSLKTSCYQVYAMYFVKYIQAMAQLGIPISAVTPQNEPLHTTASYPCMGMSMSEQASFIKTALGPVFKDANIKTKIIIYDHNWDNTDYAISILNDKDAASFIAGSAFHAYAGDVSAMNKVHLAHPQKELYFTEISGGAWATNFSDNLIWNLQNIFIGTAQNWSKTALLWNLALDQDYGPKNNGCTNCRGVITINNANGKITRNEEYYSLAHFSKFIQPGAKRIKLQYPVNLNNITAVAFLNPDGSKVMVALNLGNETKTFSISQENKHFVHTLQPKSVSTLTWQ